MNIVEEVAKVELIGMPDVETHLSIEPGDTLVVEYVKMPIFDLSYRMVWRFLKPIPTCWLEGQVSVIGPMMRQQDNPGMSVRDAYNEELKEFFLSRWHKDLITQEIVNAGMEWAAKVDKVELHECHIVRKPEVEDAESD